MKSIFKLCLALVCILSVLTGCAQPEQASKNAIQSMKLTPDQEEIVNLLSSPGSNQEILLFEYSTQDAYKEIEIWAEFYKDGVFTERIHGANMIADEAKPFSGQLGVIISHNEAGISWAFSLFGESTLVRYNSDPVSIDADGLARGYGPISSPEEIEPGKEIVLYSAIYARDGAIRSDWQSYIDDSEALSQHPYAHVIKCKFE